MRDEYALTKTDASTFALLAEGPLTSRGLAAALHKSESFAQHSLARLVIHGLATYKKGVRIGSGSLPGIWTMVPGAAFLGPTLRKNTKERVASPRPMVEAPGPGEIPLQLRRAGSLPDYVAARMGLAGLVAQITT